MSIVSCSTTTTTAYKVTADTTGTLVLQTGATPTTAVTIDGSQNVGVGVTPSTWTTGKVVEVGFAGSSLWGLNAQNVLLGNNYYYNGNFKFTTANNATSYQQSNGQHYWLTNSNTPVANATITFTQAMTLDASGNLLVGTTSATRTGQSQIKSTSTASALRVETTGATVTAGVLEVVASGATASTSVYLITGTCSGVDRIYVYTNGNVVNTNNSYGAISDVKLKENITDATPKLEKLNQVRVVNYNLIGDTQKQIGVIAQELEQVFPSMVEESPDRDAEGNELGTTTKSVKYSVFVPMLIKALQEQQALITQLQADVAALKGAA
jgi:hypothetical protein